MSTFDGWETRLYGDAMALPSSELMHFRTKGSKNGVRRYQTESGAWTPLGLKERKAREGWGETKAQKKAAKLQKKQEKRQARKARVAAAKEAYVKRRAANSVKNLSDAELQQRINRVKKEIEYKELTKSPLVKAGEKLVSSYFESKDKKLDRDLKRAELIVRQQEARQRTLQAKTGLVSARGNILDNIIRGAKYNTAKTNLINAKADKTLRGAIRQAVGGVIKKEGERIVKDMGDHSLVMRGGKKIKSAAKKAGRETKEFAKAAYAGAGEEYLKRKRNAQKKKRSRIGLLDNAKD